MVSSLAFSIIMKKIFFCLWQWIFLILLAALSDKKSSGVLEVIAFSVLIKNTGSIIIFLGLLWLEIKSYCYGKKNGFSYMTLPISIAYLLQELLFNNTLSLLWIIFLFVCFGGIKIGQCVLSYKRYRNILKENRAITYSILCDFCMVIFSFLIPNLS